MARSLLFLGARQHQVHPVLLRSLHRNSNSRHRQDLHRTKRTELGLGRARCHRLHRRSFLRRLRSSPARCRCRARKLLSHWRSTRRNHNHNHHLTSSLHHPHHPHYSHLALQIILQGRMRRCRHWGKVFADLQASVTTARRSRARFTTP